MTTTCSSSNRGARMCCLSQWHFYVQLLESNYYYATRSRSCLSRRARRVRNILAHFLFCLSGNFLFERKKSEDVLLSMPSPLGGQRTHTDLLRGSRSFQSVNWLLTQYRKEDSCSVFPVFGTIDNRIRAEYRGRLGPNRPSHYHCG